MEGVRASAGGCGRISCAIWDWVGGVDEACRMLTLSAAWDTADVAFSTAFSVADDTLETAFSVEEETVEIASDELTAKVDCCVGIGASSAFKGTEEYALPTLRSEIREMEGLLDALIRAASPMLEETESWRTGRRCALDLGKPG
jgi:hypothetical protein